MRPTLIFIACVAVALAGYAAYSFFFPSTRFEVSLDENIVRSSPPDVVDTAVTMRVGTPLYTNLGKWTRQGLTDLVQSSQGKTDVGEQIDFISEKFLDTPYEANTLVGTAAIPEKLTVHLAGLDCFTYIDYVEAARHSDSYTAFIETLEDIRYKQGAAAFQNRNHFFSDWVEYNSAYIRDVTKGVGGGAAVSVEKHLNQKKDGGVFLEGVPTVTRIITYIPTDTLTDTVIDNLRTGDYIGIYTDIDGLDVTHTGILIKRDGAVYLRHASSREAAQRVLDDDLLDYLKNKPGIVVYRPY